MSTRRPGPHGGGHNGNKKNLTCGVVLWRPGDVAAATATAAATMTDILSSSSSSSSFGDVGGRKEVCPSA
jgi:hypothetical protein